MLKKLVEIILYSPTNQNLASLLKAITGICLIIILFYNEQDKRQDKKPDVEQNDNLDEKPDEKQSLTSKITFTLHLIAGLALMGCNIDFNKIPQPITGALAIFGGYFLLKEARLQGKEFYRTASNKTLCITSIACLSGIGAVREGVKIIYSEGMKLAV